MIHPIGMIFVALLCRLLPGRGRHRAAGPRPVTSRKAAPRLVPPHVPTQQPGQRRVLWLAVHGIDEGLRLLHGAAVAAR